jgi:hypothetical protein
MPESSKRSLSLGFPHQNPVSNSPLPHRATCPVPLIPLDLITRTICGELYRSVSSSVCGLLYHPVTSSHLGPSKIGPITWLKLFVELSNQIPTFSVEHCWQWTPSTALPKMARICLNTQVECNFLKEQVSYFYSY